MARGGNRDVNLIIKAKNEASRVIGSAAEPLRLLKGPGAALRLGRQKPTNPAQLGNEFRQLGAGAGPRRGKVAGHLDRAAQAVARLKAEVLNHGRSRPLDGRIGKAGAAVQRIATQVE